MFSVSLISSVRHPIIPRSPPLGDFLGHAEEKGWREWSKSIRSFPPRIMLREREKGISACGCSFDSLLALQRADFQVEISRALSVGRTVGRTRPEYAAAAGCCSRRLAPLKMQMSPQPPRRRHHFSGGYTHFDEHGTAHNFAIVPLRQTNTQQRPRILILTYHGDCPMLIRMRVSGNDGERASAVERDMD